MSSRFAILIFAVVLFSGCSQKEIAVGDKAFEHEDEYIMKAIFFEDKKEYQNAANYYHELFKYSKKLNYKIEEIKMLFLSSDFEHAKNSCLEFLKEYKNSDVKRYLIKSLIALKEYDSAKAHVEELLLTDKIGLNYELLATIYLSKKEYQKAIDELYKTYEADKNENIAFSIGSILYYYLDKKQDAISFLETHVRIYECSKNICFKLIEFYNESKNLDAIANVYKKLYSIYPEEPFLNKIVEIYIYKKEYQALTEYLEQVGEKDDVLLDLYRVQKMYKKASQLSKKVYEKTGDIKYLANSAIFEYEAIEKKTKQNLKNVIEVFEKVLLVQRHDTYLNYLGYMLIEHEIDVKRGVELVNEALLLAPDSPYYLDSLAWGYFKQNRCKEAYKIMKKVVEMIGFKEEEIKFHFEEIYDCLQKQDTKKGKQK